MSDFAWLTSGTADPQLAWAGEALDGGRKSPTPALIERLRRELSVERAHLVVQQVELRYRAARKFCHAERMFFTPVLLEQATSEAISRYKATIYPLGPVVDLCCGIGGDAIGLVCRGGPVLGVDRDEQATRLMEWNVSLYAARCSDSKSPAGSGVVTKEGESVQVQVGEVADAAVGDYVAWHIDPDRRPEGRRTTQIGAHDPGLEVMEVLLAENPNAALKLAPAAEIPSDWIGRCEREWIGEQRECKQQLVRHGSLAREGKTHTATVVDSSGIKVAEISGEPDDPVEYVSQVGAYLYEPHAAVRAAGLVGAMANRFGLQRIGLATAYMTGELTEPSAALARFRVLASLPFDRKQLKKRIRLLGLGPLEVKTRGLQLNPAEERKKLTSRSSGEPGTVFLFEAAGKKLAVIAQRLT